VKCKQGVCRPFGGISPLSDRAPRDNGNEKGPSGYDSCEGNIGKSLDNPTFPGSKSMACRYSKRRNLGDPLGVNSMLNCEYKKDNFKASMILLKEVRLFHSSVEGR